MELQKLSSEVSRGGFIDVSVEVGGDIFFHRGQIFGDLAEKICHVRIDTKKICKLEPQFIGRGGKNIVCERTCVYAKEVRRDSLAKVANNDIEIGEATAVKFAKIRC
jgi:hypothetical protein